MTVLDRVSDGGLITRMLDIANGLGDVIKLGLFTIRWEAQISGLSFRAFSRRGIATFANCRRYRNCGGKGCHSIVACIPNSEMSQLDIEPEFRQYALSGAKDPAASRADRRFRHLSRR